MEQTTDCIFCKIGRHEVDGKILHETDTIMILQDIMPKAPVHVLLMPKKHIPTVSHLTSEDAPMIAELVLAAKDYASQSGVAESGYKLVFNNGKQGGQIIPHLHMHFLAGKQLEE